ncbi:MAG TPA: SAF domain-containing protein [Acidimicrobiales bacterium]|nr:SAF domain-containing protein [Acidimicrobiales bacterium]
MRRSSAAWWFGAAVLALATGGVVRSSVARSSALLDQLGPLRSVPVVVRPVSEGDVVGRADIRFERRPASTIPDDDVGASGRVAIVALVPGEVLVASRLAPDGLRGAAALLPSGMRALSVPAGPAGRPPAAVGDHVDVLATDADLSTVVVAEAALVLAVDDESDAVTIAVPADDTPAVVSAIAGGTVTLALTAP